MQTHGLNDQLVPFDTAKWLHELLIKNHAQVTTNNTSVSARPCAYRPQNPRARTCMLTHTLTRTHAP